MKRYPIRFDVVTCSEAASAKGIPLANELKTLLIVTSLGLYALHVPGNCKASLRTVKRFLRAKQSFLLPRDELAKIGLAPGIVCPILDPIWSLPHLVSSSVLDLEFISTNSGDKSHYFTFEPTLLLKAREVSVGDFVHLECVTSP
jgi:prolyl-tRNA editing enzyme YbaK/EbsC (Cys-tRNA(Pro) deacylase)